MLCMIRPSIKKSFIENKDVDLWYNLFNFIYETGDTLSQEWIMINFRWLALYNKHSSMKKDLNAFR